VARAGTESLNNCMFFYIVVLVKNIVGWEFFNKRLIFDHEISISSNLI